MTREPLTSCWILPSRGTGRPFFVHSMLGAGSPPTEQLSTTLSERLTACLSCGISTLGGTEVRDKKFTKAAQEKCEYLNLNSQVTDNTFNPDGSQSASLPGNVLGYAHVCTVISLHGIIYDQPATSIYTW